MGRFQWIKSDQWPVMFVGKCAAKDQNEIDEHPDRTDVKPNDSDSQNELSDSAAESPQVKVMDTQ